MRTQFTLHRRENTTQDDKNIGQSGGKSNMIKEKIRTRHGECLVCGKRIDKERIEKDYNEPFCSDRCGEFFYEKSGLPANIRMKFVRHYTALGLSLCTHDHNPPFFQKVLLYTIEEGLPDDFIPLGRDE